MLITFISIGILQNIFKKNVQELVIILIKLRNIFLRKIINSFQIPLYKNLTYADILNFFIVGIGLYMGIAAIFHYLDRSYVEGLRIF